MKDLYKNIDADLNEKENDDFREIIEYDFQNLKLSILAQKIKSQAICRVKPKMLYY
ncbi:hypothetical protein IJ425_02010 [bacterium]|nr:hypothetical protein [bacterium]